MPLSENEQNILDEIERHLHQTDPDFVREVGRNGVYGPALTSIRWGAVGLVTGVVVMLGTLQVHFLLAFVGFVIMVASGLSLERNFRMMGRLGINQVSSAIRSNAQQQPRSSSGDLADD